MVSPTAAQPEANITHSTVSNGDPAKQENSPLPELASEKTPNSNSESKTVLPVENNEPETPQKTLLPAPIPLVNVWQARKEALDAKKVTEVTNIINGSKEKELKVDVSNGGPVVVEGSETVQEPDPMDDPKKFQRKSIKKPKLQPVLPPLEDQSSWPAPAEVLIKDKQKEANDSSDRKQSTDLTKKEDGSPKRGKGKWIRYDLTITHTTPVPSHGQKHRRRSEDSARERRAGEKSVSNTESDAQAIQPNGSSHQKRRASVPPPNGYGQYGRRYSQSGGENSQIGGSFRGGRRGGRGRPYNGTRGQPRSATFPYSSTYSQQFGSLFTSKYPIVYDVEVLKYYILQQIEYYFSIENLCKDIYLRSNMDSQGYVDISLLANFNRVKQLTLDENLVRESLLNSYIVEINGEKARKRDGWEIWLLPNQSPSNEIAIETTDVNSTNFTTVDEIASNKPAQEINKTIELQDEEDKENQEVTGKATGICSYTTDQNGTQLSSQTIENIQQQQQPLTTTASR